MLCYTPFPHPPGPASPPESRDFQPNKLKIFKHKTFFFCFALSYAINYSDLEVQILVVSNGVWKCVRVCVCVVKVSSSQRKLHCMPLLPVCMLLRLIY